MGEAVIVDYVRTPFGKRNGWLSGVHSADLLGPLLAELLRRNAVDPARVEQVIGGCVTQVAEQTGNIARTAWLGAGLPWTTGVSTIDNQCGSAQQATGLLASQINAGVIEVAIACGVESMSRLPLGTSHDMGSPTPPGWDLDMPHQVIAADRIATKRGLTRGQLDAFAARSQERAAAAWDAGFFDGHVVSVELAEPFQPRAKDGSPAGDPVSTVSKDQGLRATTAEKLGALKPVHADGFHTAGNSSQISDGATALLLMDSDVAASMGVRPRARIVAQNIVGSDPYYHLDGPVESTERLLRDASMTIDDVDVFEVNEAFASVVLSWMSVYEPPEDRVNPHGGAIAVGHPVGVTGARLLGQALVELEHRDAETALVTMCCGGAQATGTILQRL